MSSETPRILVVDDSSVDICMLGNLLKELASVSFARSGEQALMLARGEAFDAILLDVVLDDMDGFELCRRIKELPLHGLTPIIFVTRLCDHDSEEMGLSLGALDFITKPFAPALVKARVRNYIALGYTQRALKEANAELSRLAVMDPLTGLTNRRYFDTAADTELRRADRQGQPVALLALDLDHFKLVNDTHGHGTGDAVLTTMAQAWRRTLRSEDILCRIGGEEFVALLPNTSAEQAESLAQRLLTVTRRQHIDVDGVSIRVTTSIGIAMRPAGSTLTIADMLCSGDAALYAAKRTGRDRAVLGAPAARRRGAEAEHPAAALMQ
ncbi:diguanylate cyclase [Novispirillum sp. DQ9]|uniref:GGDEF domain-containing response regulator n=1 Tax=Novispirillum sp. DQ9 TaxID=3398612 RepID=UPI003C79E6C9